MRISRALLVPAIALGVLSVPVHSEEAKPGEGAPPSPAQIEKALGLAYQVGNIEVAAANATLSLGDRFKFLDAAAARKVLVDLWGNPPQSAESVHGLIIPAAGSVAAPESWAVILRSEHDGHVEDDDAAKINYDKLLKQMQKSTAQSNTERVKAGFEPVHVVGWAARPYYDRDTHKLHWAKELAFGDPASAPHTLNYDIRVLGRDSVLELTVVAEADQLAAIGPEIEALLPLVNFKEGARYADYRPGVDKIAAYGIAGLVAGNVLAKAGFFKVLLGLLVAGKKLVIVAVIAIGAFLKKWLGGRSDSSRA